MPIHPVTIQRIENNDLSLVKLHLRPESGINDDVREIVKAALKNHNTNLKEINI